MAGLAIILDQGGSNWPPPSSLSAARVRLLCSTVVLTTNATYSKGGAFKHFKTQLIAFSWSQWLPTVSIFSNVSIYSSMSTFSSIRI